MKTKLLSILFLLLASFTFAQEVGFTAKTNREKLGINERLRIDFTMTENGDNFNPPDFRGFSVVAGPSQSIRNSWVNGKRSFEKTYTYYLKPNARGNFTIGQATVEIKGELYKTTPIPINVTAAVSTPTDGDNQEILSDTDIHLIAKVSKTKPYLNEGILVEYVLYVSPKVEISNYNIIDSPKFADFWSQEINIKSLNFINSTYNGEPYRKVVLQKSVLYPQKTGKLKIEPLAISLGVGVPSNRRDIFGRRLYETIDKTVAASMRTIDVQPLPEKDKPANFTGAVGSFDFSVTASRTSLDATESLQAKVRVSGKGNFKLFEIPRLKTPASLEVYEPEHLENVNTNERGMYGNITNAYTIVPQQKGKYPIQPISFSYFDVNSKTYKTLTSKEILITVENGPLASSTPQYTGEENNTSVQKQPVVSAGKQFKYIKLDGNLSDKKEEPFLGSYTYWGLMFLSLGSIPIVFMLRKKAAVKTPESVSASKKADKLAKKYLSAAKKNLGDSQAFYIALEKALHNYLKAKLSLSTAEMSKEKIEGLLEEKGVETITIQQFIKLLKSCEFARYAPTSSTAIQEDYSAAVQVITKLDKEI